MSMRSITEHFAYIGASLTNARYCWGAQRSSDKAIFLRVWVDEGKKVEGRMSFAVLKDEYNVSLGKPERQGHLELIKAGAPCYLIVCTAKNPKGEERAIKTYNDRELWVGGQVFTHEGHTYIEALERIPTESVK